MHPIAGLALISVDRLVYGHCTEAVARLAEIESKPDVSSDELIEAARDGLAKKLDKEKGAACFGRAVRVFVQGTK